MFYPFRQNVPPSISAGDIISQNNAKSIYKCPFWAQQKGDIHMAKMVKCKVCGHEIAKSAKVCPNCGAKRKKHVFLGVLLVIIGIALIVAAFGGGDEQPKKVENDTTQNENKETGNNTPNKNEPTIFGVGESAELNDVIVTLRAVKENNGTSFNTPSEGNVFIVCEFEIENNSNSELGISSLLSFEAYVDGYSTGVSLSALLTSDVPQLDGAIAPGKKMRGVVGYEAPADWKAIEIRFKSNVWASKEYIFEYTK